MYNWAANSKRGNFRYQVEKVNMERQMIYAIGNIIGSKDSEHCAKSTLQPIETNEQNRAVSYFPIHGSSDNACRDIIQ